MAARSSSAIVQKQRTEETRLLFLLPHVFDDPTATGILRTYQPFLYRRQAFWGSASTTIVRTVAAAT